MIGFEAISHHNGWVAAATGACIVFSGLITLSIIISQLHKLVALLDRPKTKVEVVSEEKPVQPQLPDCPTDVSLIITRFMPLIEELDPEFELAELYILAKKYHVPHPHLSIRSLIESGKLHPLGDGIFRYND
ncbi:OadG family protein [Desulfobulbus rhabdoformis]|uniref:OadG family transporter subunit n=1 Tax=Desulfobulbus rhabdoformis TaxID=34032 RepID=UPI0019665EA1|nr:OadG family transporter subunit [Desulfobulbus rhabdoformis]MBM9613785.1 OadG family protein [Desulfobulbus rhabdoformis]